MKELLEWLPEYHQDGLGEGNIPMIRKALLKFK